MNKEPDHAVGDARWRFRFGVRLVQFRGALYVHCVGQSGRSTPDANGNTVDVWTVTLTSGNASQNGSFSGDSGSNGGGSGAGAGNPAWALYANSGQESRAIASIASLTNVSALSVAGEYISLDFDNGWVESGGRVGVAFLDGGDNTQFAFRFVGGASTYEYTDFSGTMGISKGFTADGFNLKLTLTDSSGGYTADVTGLSQITGTLQQNTSTIASLRVFNLDAGPDAERNVFFNNLTINAVPEVSPALAIPFALAVTGLVTAGRRRRSVRLAVARA